MNDSPNSDPPKFNIDVGGGQGVQAGTGNKQFNQYITVHISAPAEETGIIEAAHPLTAESRKARSDVISKVPRTREQLDGTIKTRPLAWEYLLFAGALVVEMEDLDPRYRDYLIGYAPRSGSPVYEADFIEFYQIQLNELINISGFFQQIFSTQAVESAIGPSGVAGDPTRILHLAKRYISVYDEFLRWTERLRGTPVPRKYQRLADILTRYSEQPIAEIRRFVNTYAEQIECLPDMLKAGTSVRLNFPVTFKLAPELSQELNDEFARLKAELTPRARS